MNLCECVCVMAVKLYFSQHNFERIQTEKIYLYLYIYTVKM